MEQTTVVTFISILMGIVGAFIAAVGMYALSGIKELKNDTREEFKNCKQACQRELDGVREWQERQDIKINEIDQKVYDIVSDK